jgi:hypothetical protein
VVTGPKPVAGSKMVNNDSLIKARYTLAVLKLAQSSEREAAIMFVEGLKTEQPHDKTGAELAQAHRDTIKTFRILASSLREIARSDRFWDAAFVAAERWRRLAERG